MAKEYRITWTDKQKAALKSAVRKYNYAVRKAKAANPAFARLIPEPVKYQDVKAEILTARQLRNKVASLERAKAPRAFEFVKQREGFVTRYERREYTIVKAVRERRKAAELRKDPLVPGKLATLKQAALMPDKKKAGGLTREQMLRYVKTQSKMLYEPKFVSVARWRDNYIKAMKSEYAGLGSTDEGVLEIERIMRAKDPEELEALLEGAPEITFIYDPVAKQYKIDTLLDYFRGNGKRGGKRR